MELEKVPLELAKMLKAIGFDWKTEYQWLESSKGETDDDEHGIQPSDRDYVLNNLDLIYNIPTLALVQMYFREVHNIYISVNTTTRAEFYGDFDDSPDYILTHQYRIIKNIDNFRYTVIEWSGGFDTYNEALTVGLKEAVKLIKN